MTGSGPLLNRSFYGFPPTQQKKEKKKRTGKKKKLFSNPA
jgi:hypothetical protein